MTLNNLRAWGFRGIDVHSARKGKAVGKTSKRSHLNHTHRESRASRKQVKAINAQSPFPATYFLQPVCPSYRSYNLPRQHRQLGPTVQTCEPIRDISHSNHHEGLKRNFNKQEIEMILTSTWKVACHQEPNIELINGQIKTLPAPKRNKVEHSLLAGMQSGASNLEGRVVACYKTDTSFPI